MTFKYDERFVTEKGTVYCAFIGNSEEISQSVIKEKSDEIKVFKGQRVNINGKESVVLDARVSGRCNLINTNYYVEILTDEEFVINHQI